MGLDQNLYVGKRGDKHTKPARYATLALTGHRADGTKEELNISEKELESIAGILGWHVAGDGKLYESANLDEEGKPKEALDTDSFTKDIYFRKFNALQVFLEDNLQIENCEPKEVPLEMVKKLEASCEKILEIKDANTRKETAEQLLPTGAGFFYGSLDYDEYYYENVQRLLDFINENGTDDEVMYVYDCWY